MFKRIANFFRSIFGGQPETEPPAAFTGGQNITQAEADRAIKIKKELRGIVMKTGDERLIRADRAYHEVGNRWLVANGFAPQIQARGGNT